MSDTSPPKRSRAATRKRRRMYALASGGAMLAMGLPWAWLPAVVAMVQFMLVALWQTIKVKTP